MMASFVRLNIFRMSLYKNILVNDPLPFDILINDIPPKGLEGYVSLKLKTAYLSKYEGSQEKLLKMRKYQGAMIGDHSRIFFSIPTALYDVPRQSSVNTPNYYYVHYLLDTGSPFSTLTYEAFCSLKGKQQFPLLNYSQGFDCIMAGKVVKFYPSNPDLSDKSLTNYHNVNLLGMNFLRKFKRCKHEEIFDDNTAVLELIE